MFCFRFLFREIRIEWNGMEWNRILPIQRQKSQKIPNRTEKAKGSLLFELIYVPKFRHIETCIQLRRTKNTVVVFIDRKLISI